VASPDNVTPHEFSNSRSDCYMPRDQERPAFSVLRRQMTVHIVIESND
jgi:hypothetical protein